MVIFGTVGQGLKQFIELGTAFLLSALIGLEREVRRKSAGLRTYAVVGTTAALSACLQVWLHRRTYSWSGRPRPLSCRSPDRYRYRLHRSWADLRKRRSSQRPHHRRYHLARHRSGHGLWRGSSPPSSCGHRGLLCDSFSLSQAHTTPPRITRLHGARQRHYPRLA
jgi:MgtC family